MFFRDDFLAKTMTYNLWFNAVRKNSYKGDKTPWDIVQERNPNISPDIVALPPFYLDGLFNKKFDSMAKKKGGGVRGYSASLKCEIKYFCKSDFSEKSKNGSLIHT